MAEKTPRIRPHERLIGVNPYLDSYKQRLGQLSLTDGMPIPREAPREIRLCDPPEDGYEFVPPDEAA